MSTAKFDTWLNSDGTTNYKCRAWVNFNGTGTVAIRAAGNVTSITDNGTGDYTVNFTTAMPDANYSYAGGGSINDGFDNKVLLLVSGDRDIAPASGSLRINTVFSGNTAIDAGIVTVTVFR